MNPEQISAVAELVSALAWPSVAVLAGVLFRTELRDLAKRLRKGGGAEFDPQNQPVQTPPTLDALESSTSIHVAQLPTSPKTIEFEKMIRDHPPLGELTIPKEREDLLVRLLARLLLVLQFEQLETGIWGSQIALLAHLNMNRQGVPLSTLIEMFYLPAAKNFPDGLKNYPFEQYLAFLRRAWAIEVDEQAQIAKITQQGIEYLAWRAEQGKGAKIFG